MDGYFRIQSDHQQPLYNDKNAWAYSIKNKSIVTIATFVTKKKKGKQQATQAEKEAKTRILAIIKQTYCCVFSWKWFILWNNEYLWAYLSCFKNIWLCFDKDSWFWWKTKNGVSCRREVLLMLWEVFSFVWMSRISW